MPEWLRNTGIVILLAALVFVVLQVTTHARKLDIDTQVQRIGEKLLTLLPDGSNQQVIDEYSAELQERIARQEVDPQEVERLVAGLLNARQTEAPLNSEQLRALIDIARLPKAMAAPPVAQPAPTVPHPVAPEDWVALEQRMDDAMAFNDMMDESSKMLALPEKPEQSRRYFHFDDGLQIVVDDTVKNFLKRLEFKKLALEVERLDNEHQIRWETGLNIDIETDKEEIQAALLKLEAEINKNDPDFKIRYMHKLKIMEAIKALDSLDIVIPISVDSVFEIVENNFGEFEFQYDSDKDKN